MPNENCLHVQIGDCLILCDSADDVTILEPVDRLLSGGSTAAYTVEELETMVVTLERYGRRTGRRRNA
jgi:hypothetical protein